MTQKSSHWTVQQAVSPRPLQTRSAQSEQLGLRGAPTVQLSWVQLPPLDDETAVDTAVLATVELVVVALTLEAWELDDAFEEPDPEPEPDAEPDLEVEPDVPPLPPSPPSPPRGALLPSAHARAMAEARGTTKKAERRTEARRSILSA